MPVTRTQRTACALFAAVFLLDVKNDEDLGTVVDAIVAHGAEDFVFVAISQGEAETMVPALPGTDRVFFLSYGTEEGVAAAREVNVERGYTP